MRKRESAAVGSFFICKNVILRTRVKTHNNNVFKLYIFYREMEVSNTSRDLRHINRLRSMGGLRHFDYRPEVPAASGDDGR